MRIENSVTRVTVRHHEACRVKPNSYPEWRNFQFAPNNHYRFCFLHTLPSMIVFKLGFALFYQLMRWNKYSLGQEMFGSVPIYDVLMSCTRSSYTPWCKMEISRMVENRGKPCRVCKNNASVNRLSMQILKTWKTQNIWTFTIFNNIITSEA